MDWLSSWRSDLMLQRLLAFILIPFFAMGNSLAHSHGSAAQSAPSQIRPHFHFGSSLRHGHNHDAFPHAHHGHSHRHEHKQPAAPLPSPLPVDHDSDAVYLVASEFLTTAADPARLLLRPETYVLLSVEGVHATHRHLCCDLLPFLTDPGPPLYRVHAVLRL